MKIAITGSNGFIGSHLIKYFTNQGHLFIPLLRNDFDINNKVLLMSKLKDCDIVINLAGAPINVRWTAKNMQLIYNSRINVTKSLVAAINQLQVKPALFISTSAVGYYPALRVYNNYDFVSANTFLSAVCRDWELEASKIDPAVRLVVFRLGVVIGSDGGIFPILKKVFNYGAGAQIGNGKQYFSWIYITDLMKIYEFIIMNKHLNGVFDCTTEHIINNLILSHIIAKELHRPCLFRIPTFLLKLLLKDGAVLLTDGQAVYPKRLIETGFKFQYPTIKEAIQAALNN